MIYNNVIIIYLLTNTAKETIYMCHYQNVFLRVVANVKNVPISAYIWSYTLFISILMNAMVMFKMLQEI